MIVIGIPRVKFSCRGDSLTQSGSVFQVIAYALQAPALPFPVFAISYAINGVGIALQVKHMCSYILRMITRPETRTRKPTDTLLA